MSVIDVTGQIQLKLSPYVNLYLFVYPSVCLSVCHALQDFEPYFLSGKFYTLNKQNYMGE